MAEMEDAPFLSELAGNMRLSNKKSPTRPDQDALLWKTAVTVLALVGLLVMGLLWKYEQVPTEHLAQAIQNMRELRSPLHNLKDKAQDSKLHLLKGLDWHKNRDPSQVVGLYFYNSSDTAFPVNPQLTYISDRQLPPRIRINPHYRDSSYEYDRLTMLIRPDHYIQHAWYG
jgi:hypothetical protein